MAYPDLPAPEQPEPGAWRAALEEALGALPARPTVIAHSLGCLLCLHAGVGARAERVLLVAPPSRAGAPPPLHAWFPVPLQPASAGDARLVCAPEDPYCPGGAARVYGAPLGIPVDVLPGAGHVIPYYGFGPWPEAEAWCYGASAIASSRIAPG